MTFSVTFDPSVGGDGNTYTDDANPTTGMAGGGHRVRFMPCIANVLTIGQYTQGQAIAARTAANDANNAATAAILSATSVSGTSTTSQAIASSGNVTLTTQTGKSFYPGQTLVISNSPTAYMRGICSAYNSGTGALTMAVTGKKGTGTFTAWNITVSTSPVDTSLGLSSTSTTSLAIGKGAKTLTIEGDKLFVPGQQVSLFNSTGKQMVGIVTAYNVDTGSMTVNVTWVDTGTGTFASWAVAIAAGVSDLLTQTVIAAYVSQIISSS